MVGKLEIHSRSVCLLNIIFCVVCVFFFFFLPALSRSVCAERKRQLVKENERWRQRRLWQRTEDPSSLSLSRLQIVSKTRSNRQVDLPSVGMCVQSESWSPGVKLTLILGSWSNFTHLSPSETKFVSAVVRIRVSQHSFRQAAGVPCASGKGQAVCPRDLREIRKQTDKGAYAYHWTKGS